MLSVDQAQELIIAESSKSQNKERVFLEQAAYRVCAEDILALRNLPPKDNSAMDGYGLRAEDIVDACFENPVELKIVGQVLAGDKNRIVNLQKGEAIRIMTGAQVPASVDTVVMRENTDESDVVVLNDVPSGTVKIKVMAKKGTAIRLQGEDVLKNTVICASGTLITPAYLNLIAQAGHVQLSVIQVPKVAIIASGNELKEPGTSFSDDDIINSNSYAIAALLRKNGAEVSYLGITEDTLEAHIAALEKSKFADVIITIGGVSMGSHDFVRPALEQIGARLSFWKVAMRPGKPLAYGHFGACDIFALPGNPVSSLVSTELFVVPALKKKMGLKKCLKQSQKACIVGDGMRTREGFTFFARAHCFREDGQLKVSLGKKQSSGQISGLAEANALAVIAAKSTEVHAGELIDVLIADEYLGVV